MKQLGVLLIILMLPLGAFAQDTGQTPGASFGVVIYAEGNAVSVIRDLRRTEYDAFTGELLGLALYPGDRIQTDPDTFVEIQFLPSRSVMKVAENTSFTIEQVSASGDGVFNLAYGRLRARVNRLAGQTPFEIRGVGATAGVRGTDFGTDVIVQAAGGASLTRIYCFEGEVHVEVGGAVSGGMSPEPASETELIVVTANQMVTATTLSPTAAASAGQGSTTVGTAPATAIGVIPPAISEFWQRKNFVAEANEADAVLAQFPNLRADATSRLGSVAFLQTGTPEPVAVPPVEPLAVVPVQGDDQPAETAPGRQEIRATDAVSIEGDGDVVDTERRDRLIGATKAAGITMTALGVVAEAAAVTFYFWGDQILPDWPPATDPNVLTVVAASGGVFLIGGILSLLFSLQLGQ